jgi:hypothetical protein
LTGGIPPDRVLIAVDKDREGDSMRRTAVLLATAGILIAAPLANAGKPADPGCFGKDRAFFISGAQGNDAEPGASEVGHDLASRGGENGALNRAYKDSCGGNPS